MKTVAQFFISIVLFTGLVAFANSANAVVITDASATFQEIVAGPTVDFTRHAPSFGESNDTIFYMTEKSASTNEVTVNLIDTDGKLDVTQTQTMSGTFESIYFSFDPVGSTRQDRSEAAGYIEFNAPILAIIGTRTLLGDSDSLFRLDDVTYAHGAMDRNDSVVISGNRFDLSIFASLGVDRMRVLFEGNDEIQRLDNATNVPEPATLTLFLLGLTAFTGLGRRKRLLAKI